MALKITPVQAQMPEVQEQKVAEPLPAEAQELDATAAAVDELSALLIELEPMKAKLKKVADLKAKLQSIAEQQDPQEQVVLVGMEYVVTYKKPTNKRTITNTEGVVKALKEKLGYQGMLALINIGMTDLDKYLTAAESAPFVETKPGSRTFDEFMPIAQAEKMGLLGDPEDGQT